MIYLFSGSRDFHDYQVFQKCLNDKNIVLTFSDKVIVGDAKGLDSMVREYCEKHSIPYQVFKADWNKYGNSAGPIRNQAMIDSIPQESKNAVRGLFFIHPSSKGTVHCYNAFKKVFSENNCFVFHL